MIKRLNYTGRRKITRDHVGVGVFQNGPRGLEFNASLALSSYGFAPDALVYVEAYRQTLFMRFSWGRVAALTPPEDRRLTEFDRPDGVRFRVKVVEAAAGADGRPARLLGLADRLSPVEIDGRNEAESLLPIVRADIPEAWRIDCSPEPELQVNERLVSAPMALARSDVFVSLVLPEALRIVLRHILIVEQLPPDDQEGWHADWLEMARNALKAGDPPTPETEGGDLTNRVEIEEWIDDAVGRFARLYQIGRKFDAWWRDGDAI
ncbi:MAG: hypothetical protein KDA32_06940 [Phycisphaerales bacterium]|nr:hypothetical protein [Phycisphaerales bacterium]